jgi:hypothetical protein
MPPRRPTTDVNFSSNDNPEMPDISKDDVIDYSFTAERTIIDTSDGNTVIASRGPPTTTIHGGDPQEYKGVPKVLD